MMMMMMMMMMIIMIMIMIIAAAAASDCGAPVGSDGFCDCSFLFTLVPHFLFLASNYITMGLFFMVEFLKHKKRLISKCYVNVCRLSIYCLFSSLALVAFIVLYCSEFAIQHMN
jgi:hypothetical protein